MQQTDSQREALVLAYGDGMQISVDQAKRDIQNCYGRILDDFITIGKRLLLIKEALPHGAFLNYLQEEFPQTQQRASEYMLIARRVMESKLPHVRYFLDSAAGDSKKKALLLLGVSDEEIDAAQKADQFLGRSLEEVGEMSYRQLKEELRKKDRDLERARAQRDKADSKIEDLTEEVAKLRSTDDPEEPAELTNLEIVWGKTRIQLGRLSVAIQDAEDEEVIASGAAMLTGLQREVSALIPLLQPLPPGAPIPQEKGGGR